MSKRHKLSKSSLLWFIKSRPYVLIPELRRRFELDAAEDDVSKIQISTGSAWIGLPERAARMVEDLARENRLGLELAVDLSARLVVGVYAYDLLRVPPGITSAPSRPPGPGRRSIDEAAKTELEPAGPIAEGEGAQTSVSDVTRTGGAVDRSGRRFFGRERGRDTPRPDSNRIVERRGEDRRGSTGQPNGRRETGPRRGGFPEGRRRPPRPSA